MGPRFPEAGAGESQGWLLVKALAISMRPAPPHHKGSIIKLGLAAHACYPSSSEVETRGSRVKGHPGLHF